MKLTPEEKRQRRIDRAHEHFRTIGIGKIFNQYKVGVASLFQWLVRLRNADENGNATCICCGTIAKWDEMHGAHYVPRTNKATIIDDRNVWPACVLCNVYRDGNLAPYRAALVKKFGEDEVVALECTRLPRNHSWDKARLAEIKVDFLDEIALHERRLGLRSG